MRIIPLVAILAITLFTTACGIATTSPTIQPTYLPGVPTFKPSTASPSFYPSDSPSTTGIISTIAGTGTSSFSGDNGPATTASLNAPFGVALDSSGTLLLQFKLFVKYYLHFYTSCYYFLQAMCISLIVTIVFVR